MRVPHVLLAVLLLNICAVVSAEEIAATSALAQELIANEKRTWELYSKGRLHELADVTADDYRDVYPDGSIVDKATYLADAPDVTVESYSLADFHVFKLSDDAALVTYYGRAVGTTPRAGRIRSEVAVTSAWVKRRDNWLNVFYRENVTELNGQRLLPSASSVPQ
jgi:hypothetical protein